MRKITRETAQAFIDGKKLSRGNTVTDGKALRLHGNLIAEKRPDGSIAATMAGWATPTTKERLNGLCELLGLGRPFYQKKHRQYFGDRKIASTETVVLKGGKCTGNIDG